MQHTVHSIGTVVSPYTQKFGIPRQPQLVPAAEVCIRLNRAFGAECVRGLEGFGYIWVQFVFHDALSEGWAPMVRPPRLGGRKKAGVFATRSPHRPNHLGLSLLKLERIGTDRGAVALWCSGGDLLDGTPVLDIKPYIPFAEAHPDAAAGFAADVPPQLAVDWLPESGMDGLPETVRALAVQSIAQDPRPAYQDLPGRVYRMTLAGYDLAFTVSARRATITEAKAAAAPT